VSVGVFIFLRIIIVLVLLAIAGLVFALSRKFFKESRKGAGIGFSIFGLLIISLIVQTIFNFSLMK
jgi:hypothetical protein